MAVFKCKMCGGELTVNNGETVAICEYCGTKQTLPKLDDDKKANLFDRANHFRRNNEFDKAMGIYEQILNEDSTDSECYWSLVLCRYGIEYVEDPSTHKRLPTVNRAQYTSIFDDEDYKSAIQYADQYQKELYEQEANTINEIQKGILAISQREEPFDVFICYKETDEKGRRTRDSVLANELYHQLTQEGYKVFFAKITLEDKLGEAYEPYIFAALNSAKVMVVIGTNPKYFSSVWVKNEWSRFLSLIKGGANKILIPAYRDMDPYDLPDEFSHLQAQDMSKLGFMQDLIRGIKKILNSGENSQATVKQVVLQPDNINSNNLLKRAKMFLDDENWEDAKNYADRILDNDVTNAYAYIILLLCELKLNSEPKLSYVSFPLSNFKNFNRALEYADSDYKKILTKYCNNSIDSYCFELEKKYKNATDINELLSCCELLENIPDCRAKQNLKNKIGTVQNKIIKDKETENTKLSEFEKNTLTLFQTSVKTIDKNIDNYLTELYSKPKNVPYCILAVISLILLFVLANYPWGVFLSIIAFAFSVYRVYANKRKYIDSLETFENEAKSNFKTITDYVCSESKKLNNFENLNLLQTSKNGMILYFPNEYSNYWQKIYSDDDKICLFSIAPQIRSRINKQIMSNNKVTAISYLNSQLKTYIENDLKNFGILQKYTEEVSLLTVSEFETLKSSNFIVPLKDFWLIPDASESNKLYFPYAFHLISGTDYYWNSKGVALKVIINRRILSDDLRTTELNKILPSIEQVFNDK